jgi:DNA-binding transcriptional LysR family regulator
MFFWSRHLKNRKKRDVDQSPANPLLGIDRRARSGSQAALDLAISQSAITTAIRQIERTIGADLFTRSQQGMELTPAGQPFLFHAYDMLNKLAEATSPSIPANDLKGRLSVAATYTVIGYLLPNHLEKMKRGLPKLDIQLFELNREAIEEGLLSNR